MRDHNGYTMLAKGGMVTLNIIYIYILYYVLCMYIVQPCVCNYVLYTHGRVEEKKNIYFIHIIIIVEY